MFTEDKVTEIFFMADEFHKVFCRMLDKYSLNTPKTAGKRPYHRAGRLCRVCKDEDHWAEISSQFFHLTPATLPDQVLR